MVNQGRVDKIHVPGLHRLFVVVVMSRGWMLLIVLVSVMSSRMYKGTARRKTTTSTQHAENTEDDKLHNKQMAKNRHCSRCGTQGGSFGASSARDMKVP